MRLLRNREAAGVAMLLFASVIWGTAFAAQSAAMDHIGPHTMNALRCLLAGVSLFPVGLFFRFREKRRPPERTASRFGRWTLPLGGLACGTALFGATALQQMGLVYTLVGKAGFITALYIVLVPVLGLFLGKPVRPVQWICVGIAVAALYLLSANGMDGKINVGDLMMLGCAFIFAVHIHLIDYFAPRVNGVLLSSFQFLTAGLLSLIPMLVFEHADPASVRAALFPILYAGLFSGGIAYTLQILGQERTNPVTGSLIMSTESLWALAAGLVFLHESLSGREYLGGALMLFTLVLSQIPIPFRKRPLADGQD